MGISAGPAPKTNESDAAPLQGLRTLHSTQGGSDKLYRLQIVSGGALPSGVLLYDVIYFNGKRTQSELTKGAKPKNNKPILLQAARDLVTALVVEKKAKKGYHELGDCPACSPNEATASSYLSNAMSVVSVAPEEDDDMSLLTSAEDSGYYSSAPYFIYHKKPKPKPPKVTPKPPEPKKPEPPVGGRKRKFSLDDYDECD